MNTLKKGAGGGEGGEREKKIAATLPETSIMPPEPYVLQHKSIIKRNHASTQSGTGQNSPFSFILKKENNWTKIHFK